MRKIIKILITARDPASANDISEVLLDLLKDRRFVIKVFAQDVAYSILLKRLSKLSIKADQLIEFKADNNEINYIKGVFNKFQPDCVLTGISGPGYGVDEIALSVCSTFKGIRSFSIQSYWGDLNFSCGAVADTIFVLDRIASKVTTQKHKICKTVITGPLQSDRYDNINIKKERFAFRSKHGYSDDMTIISVFGQPLYEYEWYRNTLRLFFKTIKKVSPEVQLVYRPHPKEKDKSTRWTLKCARSIGLVCLNVKDDSYFGVLSGSSIATSLFSTIGYDLQNILYRSDFPFSVPLYLFFSQECKEWYKNNCALDKIPMSEDDMSILVDNFEELEDKLSLAISGRFNEVCHQAIRDGLGLPVMNGKPSSKVIDELLHSVK